MAKIALTVKKTDFEKVIGKELATIPYDLVPFQIKFLDIDTSLESRDTCETDESLLQILPYMTIFSNPGYEYIGDVQEGFDYIEHLVKHPDTKIFIYARGAGGGEGRLIGKCSIGIGGHIEKAPSEFMNLLDVIVNGATLEAQEEVSLELDYDEVQFAIEESNFIIDQTNPVGKVHLGMSLYLPIDESYTGAHEEGIITKGKWMTLKEIEAAVIASEIELENWSTLVLIDLLCKFSK